VNRGQLTNSGQGPWGAIQNSAAIAVQQLQAIDFYNF
jgi:hypothetical protein